MDWEFFHEGLLPLAPAWYKYDKDYTRLGSTKVPPEASPCRELEYCVKLRL